MHINSFQLFSLLIVWLGLTGIEITFIHVFFSCLAPLLSFYVARKLLFLNRLDELESKNEDKTKDIFVNFSNNKPSFIKVILYFLRLIREIILSSIAVSKIIWHKNTAIIPATARINSIQDTEFAKVIYANSITLTPGTVTISLENNLLLVHALDISFLEDLQEGAMDRRVKKLMIFAKVAE